MLSPGFSLSLSGPVVSGTSDAAYDSTWGEVIYGVLRELRDLIGESTMFAAPAVIGCCKWLFSGRITHRSTGVSAVPAPCTLQRSARPTCQRCHQPLWTSSWAGSITVRAENAAKGRFQSRDMLDDVRRQGYAIDCDQPCRPQLCGDGRCRQWDHSRRRAGVMASLLGSRPTG